mgnify:CR=1 FL=1
METKISELNKAVSKLLIIEEDIKQIRIEIDKINSKIEKEQENVVAIGEKIKTNGLNKQVYNLAKSIQKWTETAQNIQKWAELGQNIQESS